MTELLASLPGPLAVETRGLTKRYARHDAVAGLDLTVPEGSVYVLVGPNGAGKTTTLKLLLDLTDRDAGSARVFGRDCVADGPQVRAAIGWVPEAHDACPSRLTAAELVDHHSTYFPRWDQGYAARLVERFGIDLRRKLGTLSKGQSRRVQLLLALAHRPALLLLDEPTDGLDPLARDEVLALLAEHLAETPTTVLVSTHLVHEVEGIADVVGVLANGRLTAQVRRGLLEERLHLVRAELPESWSGCPSLEGAVLQEQRRGRELAWTIWGEPGSSARRLHESGATVRSTTGLNLEEACRALLRSASR